MVDRMNELINFDQSTSQGKYINEIKERSFAFEIEDTGSDDETALKQRKVLPFGLQIRQAAQSNYLGAQGKSAALKRYSLNNGAFKVECENKHKTE